MDSPDISVIIPVFNSGSYIRRCARSLFSQTLRNIEYIFIDDCSTDESISILREVIDEYPDRRHSVKVIRNDSNIGVGQSRQKGIDMASGRFVIHCDSDDVVDADMYETMFCAALENDADVVVCGYKVVSESGSVEISQNPAFDRKTLFHQLATESLHSSFCLKMIAAPLAKSVSIEPGINHWEDFSVTPVLMLKAHRIVSLDSCPYHYYMTSAISISRAGSTHNVISSIRAAESLARRISSHSLAEYIDMVDLYRIQWSAKKGLLLEPNKENIQLWNHTFPESNLHYREIGLSRKFQLLTWLAMHKQIWLLKLYRKMKMLK